MRLVRADGRLFFVRRAAVLLFLSALAFLPLPDGFADFFAL